MATMAELAKRGISRMRLPNWSLETDYVRIDLFNGGYGPWAHLYSQLNLAIHGDNPVSRLAVDNDDRWEPYEGVISPDDTGPR